MSELDLIARLAGELKPVRRRRIAIEALLLAVMGAMEMGLFFWAGFMRPDMPEAIAAPSFWWKVCSLGLIAGIGGTVALLSFDPVRSPRRGLRAVVAVLAVCLSAGWLIDASRHELGDLATRLDWRNGIKCVYTMALLSLPAIIGLGLLMRRGAPTDNAGSALSVGIAAAAWGAFVFVFSCPFEDPLYIAVWYGIGCGFVMTFARLVLPPLTRW